MAYNPDQVRDKDGRWAADMIDKLEKIMIAKGVPNAHAEAVAHFQKCGVLKPGTEELTEEGLRRTLLGASGRAKERAARQSSGAHTAADYKRTRDGKVALK